MADNTYIRKRNKRGEEKDYYPQQHWDRDNGGWYEEWVLRGDDKVRVNDTPTKDAPNIRCKCGCNKFKVCWWDYPPVGGFCRVICANCGHAEVLIDNWA